MLTLAKQVHSLLLLTVLSLHYSAIQAYCNYNTIYNRHLCYIDIYLYFKYSVKSNTIIYKSYTITIAHKTLTSMEAFSQVLFFLRLNWTECH